MSSVPPDRRRDSSSSALSRPRGTLPPPELLDRRPPASAGQLVLEAARASAPVARHHQAPRAEAAWLAARIAELHDAGDADSERDACVQLARRLASRGTDLDKAVTFARRALALTDDPALRNELAGWLIGLGEPALAAGVLRGLCSPARPTEMATTLVRIAVLLARANDAASALGALEEAAALNPNDAIANELIGTLAVWSWQVLPETGAAAYLAAAVRRDATKDKEAAFEDRLRAFELAPDDEAAAQAIAAAVVERGRGEGASDEVVRTHAVAIAEKDAERAQQIHIGRMLDGLKAREAGRALGAALDAEIATHVGLEIDAKVDEVLTLAGMYELVALRLELRAERAAASARGPLYHELARLYAGPLASPERALEAWIAALAADPSNAAAKDALRERASAAQDPDPLVEALVRVGLAARAAVRARAGQPSGHRSELVAHADALRELAALAEDKLGDAPLAAWAYGILADIGLETHLAHTSAARLADRIAQHDAAIASARDALEHTSNADARVPILRKLATLLRGKPSDPKPYVRTLAELARAKMLDRTSLAALERAARRSDDTEALEMVLAARADATDVPKADVARARLSLASLLRRRGETKRALEHALSALTAVPGHRAAATLALVLATDERSWNDRARALVELAGPMAPAIRSVLLSIAAEHYSAAGSRDDARRAGEQACESDPTCVRAVSVLAAVAGAQRDRVGAAAVERAMAIVAPRGLLCDQLAQALESLGELPLALAWTQRWLALRPGSPRAIAELIRRAMLARDAARLAEAMSWVIAQPAPLGELAGPVADALGAMYELDGARGVALARRALDVFGARVGALRTRIIEIADKAGDRALAIAALERWIAAEPALSNTEPLLELARRRREAGDHDGAARALARAAERGAPAAGVLEHIEQIDKTVRDGGAVLGSDGRIALVDAQARALTSLKDGSRASAALAWRELGALLWDAADDRRGADAAFYAATSLHAAGIERYARDLVDFAGTEDALDHLMARASRTPDAKIHAALLVEASGLASRRGFHERALLAAATAIEVDPTRADAIALVERNADIDGGIDVLDGAYDRLADAALGCYGRRAAHYRGARQFERRGMLDRAFRHAIACFEAVPGEGTTYTLLCRLAERVPDPSDAVHALERVADKSDPDVRPTWLKRAARLAGKGEDAARTRFDLLLRAMNARADAPTIEELGIAMKELVDRGEREICAMRFDRGVRAALSRLDGPEGARTGIAMARVALAVLSEAALGAAAIERAAEVDGDVDEFAQLFDLAPKLTSPSGAAGAAQTPSEAAATLVASVRAALTKPYAQAGTALLRLTSRIAASLGDRTAAAEILIEAARRAPDDEHAVDEADAAVAALGDEPLRRALDEAVPPSRRVEVRLGVASRLEKEGNDAAAIATLERALSEPALTPEQRERVLARFRHVLRLAGRSTELELVLRTELARGDLLPGARLKLSRELASLLAERSDMEGALDVLAEAAQKLPFDGDLLAEVRRLANRTGDRRVLAELLTRILGIAPDDAARLVVLRELAPLSNELGDHAVAHAHYETITQLDGTDRDAMEALERDAASRGDHEAIALLLARRVASATEKEARKALRLRRAAVLEQRLARLDEACAELESLLEELPNDVSGLRYLADLCERQGACMRAGVLWDRLRSLATTSDEQADYGVRAAGAYLGAHDVARAKELVESVAAIAPRDAVLELRVRIARLDGDRRALAEALDLLATSSHESAERRAEMLVEAARASAGLGNDSVALERALRAAQLAPQSADAMLEVRRLEYRVRGTGTPREAQAAVDMLGKIGPQLSAPRDIELHCFLLAEELDTITGGGAGMRELSRRHAELGPLPLIALGMAERLVRMKSFEASVPLFEQALSGDLRGLRARGRVALAAAEAAAYAGELETASRLLEDAAGEPDTRALAGRRKLELTAQRGDEDAARRALEELARMSSGIDRARWLGKLADRVRSSDPADATRLLNEAIRLAGSDKTLYARLVEERDALVIASRDDEEATPIENVAVLDEGAHAPDAAAAPYASADVERSPTPADAPRLTAPEAPDAKRATAREAAPHDGELLEAVTSAAAGPEDILAGVTVSAGDQEAALFKELRAGSFEAGERLIALYGDRARDRTYDVLAVRQQQAALRPGDRAVLARLHAAALDERDAVYARAIEHVLRAFDGSPPITAPSLVHQPEAPELLQALLFRSTTLPFHEALANTFDTGIFRKEIAHYSLTPADRVQATSALGQAVSEIARLLGTRRTNFFQKRSKAAFEVRVLLLNPPGLLFTGEVPDSTPDLLYSVGSAMAGALPEHALVNGLADDYVRNLIAAVSAAFGPLAPPPQNSAVARLAQDLWQFVGPRLERRMRDICAESQGVTYDVVMDSTRRAMRRAGLYACGSIATAVHQTARDLSLELDEPLSTPQGLARACDKHPAIADLVRLAIRFEYAEARWQDAAAPERPVAPGGKVRAGA